MSVVYATLVVDRKKGQLMIDRNIEWVVSIRLEDGTWLRGIQKAWYGHPAMDFFAKKNGVSFVSSMAVKPSNLPLETCEKLGIVEYR